MIDQAAETSSSDAAQKDETDLWFKRTRASKSVREEWEKKFRTAECYNYWWGNQRDEPYEGSDRKAQHNMIYPDVDEEIASLYFYSPYGKVVASAERADTPGETVSQKARLLQDTGIYLVQDPRSGFRENTFLALKEHFWAIGCVEVGYDPNFIDNPLADRPPLRESEDTDIGDGQVKDAMGLTPDEGSDLPSLVNELKRLRSSLKEESFYVKFISSKQILISPSNKPILLNNDWVGYAEDYPLEDVKASSAYINTENLKSEGDFSANKDLGSVDRVRLYKIWDLRTNTKLVLAEGHPKFLMKKPFKRCPLKFLRIGLDPYNFFPVPPVYLKLSSQDSYNDSAEYLRKMRIATVPRFTYDEDAVTADQAAKFQSREMNIMIPRKGGTRAPIEPVSQPSTSAGAIQTLALSEKEFLKADSSAGDPLAPPTQTATRAALANARVSAQEGFRRAAVSDWLSSIIEELILLAIDNMNLHTWITVNVDLDSPMAAQASLEVAQTKQMIDAEVLRDTSAGLSWHVEVETDTLSPVSEAERGQKIMQIIQFISNPSVAMLMKSVPNLLKRMLSLGGIKVGEDLDAIMGALDYIVQTNAQAAAQGAATPGISPGPGGPAQPASAPQPAAASAQPSSVLAPTPGMVQ